MSMKKKLTVVVTAVTLVALIAIGATLAWFTDSKEVTNVVTMGTSPSTRIPPSPTWATMTRTSGRRSTMTA